MDREMYDRLIELGRQSPIPGTTNERLPDDILEDNVEKASKLLENIYGGNKESKLMMQDYGDLLAAFMSLVSTSITAEDMVSKVMLIVSPPQTVLRAILSHSLLNSYSLMVFAFCVGLEAARRAQRKTPITDEEISELFRTMN